MSKFFNSVNNDGFVNQTDPENVEIDVLKKTEDQIREALEKSYTKDKLNKQKKFNAVCLKKLANVNPEHEGLVRIKARVPVIHSILPTPEGIDDYSTMDLYPTFLALKSSFNPQPADGTDGVPPGTALVVQFDNVSNFANPEIIEISVIKSEEQLQAEGGSSTRTDKRSGRTVFLKADIIASLDLEGTSWIWKKGGKKKYPFRGVAEITSNGGLVSVKTTAAGNVLSKTVPAGVKQIFKGISYQEDVHGADVTPGYVSQTTARILPVSIADTERIHKDTTKPLSGKPELYHNPIGYQPIGGGSEFPLYAWGRIKYSTPNFKWNTSGSTGFDGAPAIILEKDSPTSFGVRFDMKEDMQAVIDEVRGNGGIIAGGTTRRPKIKISPELEAAYPGIGAAAGGKKSFNVFADTLPAGLSDAQKKKFYNDNAFSLHHTGHAIDLTTYGGCAYPYTDPYIVEYKSNADGGVKWNVWYRAPGAPVQSLKAVVMQGLTRGNKPGPATHDGKMLPQIIDVDIPCYNLTAVWEKNGFEGIRSKPKRQFWVENKSKHNIKFGKTKRQWATEAGAIAGSVVPTFGLTDGATADFMTLARYNTTKTAYDALLGSTAGAYFMISHFRGWSEWWHFDYVKQIKAEGTTYNYHTALEGFYSAKALADPAQFSPEFLEYAKLSLAAPSGHYFRIP